MASETTPAAETTEAKPEGFKRTRKDRLLMQIKSLDDNDDERTSISKRISWLLRHGAKLAGVPQEEKTKWVKLSDLNESEILKEFTPELIWKVIVDFNGKKLRYEIDEQPEGTRLRSYKRDPTSKGDTRKNADVPKGDGKLRMEAPEFAPAGSTVTTASSGGAPPTKAAVAQAQQAAAMAAYQQMMFNPMMMSMMNPYMFQAAASGKHFGTIKSFNQQKGFGFIECAATYAQYHRDVFLHKAQIGDMQVGAAVQFSCEVNKNGMPQAVNVQPAGAPPAPGKGKDGKGKGKGKGKDGKDGGKKGKGEGKGKKEGGKGKKEKKEKVDGAGEAAAEAPADGAAPAEEKPAEAAPPAAEAS